LKLKEYFLVPLFGGIGYSTLEILWRGYTHWTMALTGGIGLLVLYIVAGLTQWGFWKKCFNSCLCLTCLELMVGTVVNLYMNWHVWDYSDQPGNLFGQICPLYTVFWFFLCLLLVPVCSWIRLFLYPPRKPLPACPDKIT